MSLMTMALALATSPAVRRPDRETELEAEVGALKTELEQVRGERDTLKRALEDEWRLRAIQREYPVYYQDGHLAQHVVQHVQAQQMNQQAMQNAMSQMPLGGICNCVPARHDTFLRGGRPG